MDNKHKYSRSENYHDEMQPNPQPSPSVFGLDKLPALMFAEFFNVHGGLLSRSVHGPAVPFVVPVRVEEQGGLVRFQQYQPTSRDLSAEHPLTQWAWASVCCTALKGAQLVKDKGLS